MTIGLPITYVNGLIIGLICALEPQHSAHEYWLDLRLDVLVELGGFTGGSRLELLCHKPAPVQLSYLGYPGPTYLRCIDGWLETRYYLKN